MGSIGKYSNGNGSSLQSSGSKEVCAADLEDSSTRDLIKEMTAVARSLVREELRLAKLELSHERERVKGLVADGKSLVDESKARLKNDLALAKAELDQEVSTAKKVVPALGIGGVLLHATLFLALFTIAFVLDTFLPMWAAMLITTLLAAGAGAVFLLGGIKKAKQLKNPFTRTQNRIKEDGQWLKNSADTLRWSANETMRDARSRMIGIVSPKSHVS